jgi:hypothetical protein
VSQGEGAPKRLTGTLADDFHEEFSWFFSAISGVCRRYALNYATANCFYMLPDFLPNVRHRFSCSQRRNAVGRS